MNSKPIGIFAFGTSPIEHLKPRHLRALIGEAALQEVELLLFDAAGCDLDRGTVQVSVLRGAGWETRSAPIPDLVMVLTNPVTPRHTEVDNWLRAETRVLVSRGPDKLAQVRLLEQSPLAPYAIPAAGLGAETLESDVSDWLATHGSAVVKTVDGERGRNIHFILPAGERWALAKQGERQEGTLAEIIAVLRSSVAGRMRYRQFMIQRYIESTFGGHALALRLDVHKTPTDGWGFTRALARLNVMGGWTTNMAAGGFEAEAAEFFARWNRREAGDLLAEATLVARQAAELIDRQPMASAFEVGVDYAFDTNDQLRIVELNAQPEANWSEHDRAKYIIAYCRSLIEQ